MQCRSWMSHWQCQCAACQISRLRSSLRPTRRSALRRGAGKPLQKWLPPTRPLPHRPAHRPGLRGLHKHCSARSIARLMAVAAGPQAHPRSGLEETATEAALRLAAVIRSESRAGPGAAGAGSHGGGCCLPSLVCRHGRRGLAPAATVTGTTSCSQRLRRVAGGRGGWS